MLCLIKYQNKRVLRKFSLGTFIMSSNRCRLCHVLREYLTCVFRKYEIYELDKN